MRLRFWAVMMTALSFVLGVLPLVFASGAGAASRTSIGFVALGGMVMATGVGVVFLPMLYYAVEWVRAKGGSEGTGGGRPGLTANRQVWRPILGVRVSMARLKENSMKLWIGLPKMHARMSKRRNTMADPGQEFESLWSLLQRDVGRGDTIRNWTRDKGYIGDEFVIRTVNAGMIEVDSPGAENIQRIPREDFAKVYGHWEGYNAGHIPRSQIRDDITRFSKYIISIFHHIESAQR